MAEYELEPLESDPFGGELELEPLDVNPFARFETSNAPLGGVGGETAPMGGEPPPSPRPAPSALDVPKPSVGRKMYTAGRRGYRTATVPGVIQSRIERGDLAAAVAADAARAADEAEAAGAVFGAETFADGTPSPYAGMPVDALRQMAAQAAAVESQRRGEFARAEARRQAEEAATQPEGWLEEALTFGAELAPQFIDPTNLLPAGGTVRAARTGRRLLEAGGRGTMAAGGVAAAVEPGLEAEAERTGRPTDPLLSIGGSAVAGGAFGMLPEAVRAGVRALRTRGRFADAPTGPARASEPEIELEPLPRDPFEGFTDHAPQDTTGTEVGPGVRGEPGPSYEPAARTTPEMPEPEARPSIDETPPDLPPELGKPAGARPWWETETEPGRLGAYERVPREPTRLTRFLIRAGGINDQDPAFRGEIRTMVDAPRHGLMRSKGMSLDEATLKAWEAGYLPDYPERPDTDALMRALEDDFSGRNPRYAGDVADDVQVRDDAIRFNEMVDQVAERFGLEPRRMSRERFFEVLEELQARERDVAEADELEPVLGQRKPDLPPRREGTGDTDTTAQGPQRVIPGAERISDRELIERLMKGAKRPTKPQKDADEGLFDTGARKQGTLLSRAPTTPQRGGTLAMQAGPNYRGIMEPGGGGGIGVPDRSAVPRRAKRDILRREAIIGRFLKGLDTRLYTGRIRKSGPLGYYRRGSAEVRIRSHNDLEVTAHELAHWLDFKPELGRTFRAVYRREPYRREMKGVSYDETKLYEGFAEFIRLWMTQPEEAAARAPNFNAWFNEWARTDTRYGPVVRRAREEMSAWFNQNELDRMASKEGGNAVDVRAVLDTAPAQFRQAVLDDLQGIRAMEQELRGAQVPGGAYETARLSRGGYAIVDGAIRYGAPVEQADGTVKFEGPGLYDILDRVSHDLDDWKLYAIGRSAKELMGQGRERVFTDAEIRAAMALENRPGFKEAFDAYQAWNKKIVDFAEAKGLINPASRRLWQRMQYIPFYRATQRKGLPRKKGGIEGRHPGIRRLTGGTGNLNDILDNMVRNASHLIVEALRNEARLKVATLADTVPGSGKFMTRIGRETKAITVDKAQVAQFLRQIGVDDQDVFDELARHPEFLQFWKHGQDPKGDNIVAVMRGGRPDFYEVADPILYRSLQSLNRPARNVVWRLLSLPKRIAQQTITTTVDFMAANIFRDTVMASIMSRSGFRPILDSAKGFYSRLRQDQNYRDFIANGGGMSSQFVDENGLRRSLERFYTSRGIDYRHVLDAPEKLLGAIERFASVFEEATRVGEFMRARSKGMDARQAAFQAREVSTDFAMRGDNNAVGLAYDTIIFLKAAVNSIDRLYRGVTKDPQRAQIAVKTGLLAMASMALYLQNRGRPEYEDLEDWDRDNHWHFWLPDPTGGKPIHFRLPKIWEIGAVSSIAERSLAEMLDRADGKGNVGEYAGHVGDILGSMMGFEYLPQVIEPVAEVAINRERFTDRQIQTQAMQRLEPFARSSPYGSETIRELGEATQTLPEWAQINPAVTEHLLRGYFNTWALYGLQLSDAAFFDNKPDLRLDQYPGLRRFYVEDEGRRTKWERQFYEALNAATMAHGTMRKMDRDARKDIADRLEQKPETRMYQQLSRVDERIQAINSELRKLYGPTPNMTGAEKRDAARRLQAEKQDLFKRTMQDVRR